MSRTTAPLSDSACRSAKPTDRAYKLFDGDGRTIQNKALAESEGFVVSRVFNFCRGGSFQKYLAGSNLAGICDALRFLIALLR
ncbi:hypothetical protein [Pseudomonas sp. TB1-B1]|uniref:hypothetical protein n=1 Tax=Pseudomonas sp. TB1-B1 TaxID=2985515 RepID=UPI00226DA572|nr:hypothetical protein [Pseudomonas sp. TB1-B1]MCX9153159.1 hypothetical protein [Pseudomonas sp. TB1-B1]